MLLLTGTACSSGKSHTRAELPPVIQTSSSTQKFNMQFDFMKHHFSGLLVARRMKNEEVRLLFTTYFGLSVFDFSLRNDSLIVNSCIEPMRKKKVLDLLERDLKTLFLPSRSARVKKKSTTFEQRISGKGFGKAVFSLSDFAGNQPQQVKIKHPWIGMKIQLNELTTE